MTATNPTPNRCEHGYAHFANCPTCSRPVTTNTTTTPGLSRHVSGPQGPPGPLANISREEFDALVARISVLEQLVGESERGRIERTGTYFPKAAT